MSTPSASVVIPTLGGERLGRVLESLAAQTVEHQTIVVDNGSGLVESLVRGSLPRAEVLSLPENLGFTRAVNLGAQRADGDALVMLNDDCVVDHDFVARLVAVLDPAAGIGMAAGVMRDWRDRTLIDSAGMELDRTLLVFDYLNGEPLSILDGPVEDPVGPSAAAAAFDRATFLAVGGFDEDLFAYWEDVDLVLRLRRLGVRCALATEARGDHEHSATLGSGSARKNYLMGYGRGYVLRKWRVISPTRLGPVVLREGVLCAGQAVLDRNLAGLRGRVRGYRAPRSREGYPSELPLARSRGTLSTMTRRARRRARLRGAGPERSGDGLATLAVLHLAETSGPSKSLEAEFRWLAGRGSLTVAVPGSGRAADALAGDAEIAALDYSALTKPSGPRSAAAAAARLRRDVRMFRAQIMARRPDLVIAVTAMLPAVAIAARRERVPLLVYAGELFADQRPEPRLRRRAAARALIGATARLADRILACSGAVAAQYEGGRAAVDVLYPPIADHAGGDGAALRGRYGIPPDAPLLASVGNLTEGRGQDVLVEALPAILATTPGARCLIAGEPLPRPQDLEYRERLGATIARLGLTDSVILAGHVERLADLYSAADLIVNPVLVPESFGRVAFEAATAGTPAVVTRVGAVGELLVDGDSALIVAPGDRAAIADAVGRLLAHPELGRQLAAAAGEIVDERLRPELSLTRFQRAVEAVTAPRRPAARRG